MDTIPCLRATTRPPASENETTLPITAGQGTTRKFFTTHLHLLCSQSLYFRTDIIGTIFFADPLPLSHLYGPTFQLFHNWLYNNEMIAEQKTGLAVQDLYVLQIFC
ncbi:hypothetical protein EJ02DRAFT_420186 [Clathrospora elynae]|uniref:BTB domain-containing protein n=1 Tax=Clathrospora elynae TaxID=706981 RepID=A0A6A5SY45_9PLEO|nr:hypothetical protein EJ02DRAFT_420186 [Clathrospora elynae]